MAILVFLIPGTLIINQYIKLREFKLREFKLPTDRVIFNN